MLLEVAKVPESLAKALKSHPFHIHCAGTQGGHAIRRSMSWTCGGLAGGGIEIALFDEMTFLCLYHERRFELRDPLLNRVVWWQRLTKNDKENVSWCVWWYSQWLAKALFRNLSLHNGLSACLYLCMTFLKKFEPTWAKYRKCNLRLLRYLKPWQKHGNPTPFTLTAQVHKVIMPSEEAWAQHVEVWMVGVLGLLYLMVDHDDVFVLYHEKRFLLRDLLQNRVVWWQRLTKNDKENVSSCVWWYSQYLASALFRNLVTQWPFCLPLPLRDFPEETCANVS